MKLCSKNCIPCCDFCIHAIHEKWYEHEGEYEQLITGGPIACGLYNDKEHNDIAFDCGACNDFICFTLYS